MAGLRTGAKSLPEPAITYSQLAPNEQISVTFWSKYSILLNSRKCTRKSLLQTVGHFVSVYEYPSIPTLRSLVPLQCISDIKHRWFRLYLWILTFCQPASSNSLARYKHNCEKTSLNKLHLNAICHQIHVPCYFRAFCGMRHTRNHCTNGLWSHNLNRAKIRFILTWKIKIR